MGARGNRDKTTAILPSGFAEPTLLVGLDNLNKLAKENGCREDNSLDIGELLKYVSSNNPKEPISLEYVRMDPATSGSLSYDGGIWHIKVNKEHNPKRQKFTIAHELGHYMLHRNKATEFTDELFFRSQTKDNIEYKANEFAATLLMPEENVRKCIKAGVTNIGKLAEIFGVSAPAMKIRVIELGYKLKNNG